MAAQLREYDGQTVRTAGDFVCEKYIRTKNGKLMKFGNFFDVHRDFFDTVHFPPSLMQYPLRDSSLYLIMGRVVLDTLQ